MSNSGIRLRGVLDRTCVDVVVAQFEGIVPACLQGVRCSLGRCSNLALPNSKGEFYTSPQRPAKEMKEEG